MLNNIIDCINKGNKYNFLIKKLILSYLILKRFRKKFPFINYKYNWFIIL